MMTMSGSEEEEKMRKVEVTTGTWIDEYLPSKARPYARLVRLDKPIGIWLLSFPTFWYIALAASQGSLPDFEAIALCGFLTTLLRAAACTINHYFDRDFDAKVERTKSRPLASGALTPSQGLYFPEVQLLVILGLLLRLDNYSGILVFSAYLFLSFSYPLMKRVTFWPQAYLGFGANYLALLFGWFGIKKSLDPAILLPLYAAAIFWTMVYDTIYAHQDKKDDKKAGVKSTALKFGESTKEWISGFRIASISCLALSGFNANLGWPFYAFLVAASGQLAWQIWTVDLSSPSDCAKKFFSNKWFGAFVFMGIVFGRLWS